LVLNVLPNMSSPLHRVGYRSHCVTFPQPNVDESSWQTDRWFIGPQGADMTAKIVQAPQLRMARRISRTKVSQVVLAHGQVNSDLFGDNTALKEKCFV
jgi:hypothetical protein